jgi:iron complex outermembrane receptor protein
MRRAAAMRPAKTGMGKKRIMRIGRRAAFFAALTAIPLTSGQTHAEPAPADEALKGNDTGLDIILVTAQKREQDVQAVPVAISVMTAKDLERLQAGLVEDIQYATPSLIVAGSDPTRKRFGIRGVSDQSRNAGFDNRIGVYVDGIWVGRSAASNQPVLDVASIEILRGPQGTLFGKNNIAGAINITTEQPKQGYSGYVEGEYGNEDQRRLRGAVNLGLNEIVAARLSGSWQKRDGFTANLFTGRSYDNRDDHSLRGQLQIDTGATKLYIAADSSEFKSRATAAGERTPDPLAPKPREIAVDDPQRFRIAYAGLSAQFDHQFGNGGTITSISGFRSSDYGGSVDEDFSPAHIAATDNLFEKTSQFSQEIRYASRSGGAVDYVAGLYFLTQDIGGGSSASIFAPALDPSLPALFLTAQRDARVITDSFAGFAHADYRVTDRLELTAGARLTQERKRVDFDIVDHSTFFTTGRFNDVRKATDFSPTVSLSYFATQRVMAYARYARGFKSGGYNTDFVPSLDNIEFDDESVDSFELGVKSLAFDRRLRLSVAAYLAKYKNFQVFSFTRLANGGTALSATNAGKLTSKGIEVEAELAVSDWLSLFVNYGYNDAAFDSFKDGGGPGVDFDGNRPSEAPKHNLNIGASTDIDLGFARLVMQGDYNYRSAFYSNPDNLPVNLNSSLDQLNLRAGLDFGNHSIFGWVRNAFDVTEQIYNSRSFLGVPLAQYNDPRTYGVSVRVRFAR